MEPRRLLIRLCFGMLICGSFFAHAESSPHVKNQSKTQPLVHQHHYKKTETLWFLSELYYGKGSDYTKILKANQLPSPDGIVDGKTLLIPEPRFANHDQSFPARYDKLWKRREVLLKAKKAFEEKLSSEKTSSIIHSETPVQKQLEKKEMDSPARSALQELQVH